MFQTTQRHLCIGVALLLSSCGGLATFGNRPTDSYKANYKRACELEETFLEENAYEKWEEFVRTHPSGPTMDVPDPDEILMGLMSEIFLKGAESPSYQYGKKADRRKLNLAKHLVKEYGLAASIVPFFESKQTPEGRRFLKESALDPKIKKTRLFLQRYVDTGIYRQW
jgi:hypothetical protein